MVGYSHHVHTSFVPGAMSCQDSQDSQLNRIFDYLSSQVGMHSTLQYYESKPLDMKLPGCAGFISPYSLTQLCSVFSNRILLSSSGGKPTALTMAYYAQRSLELTYLVNNSKRGNQSLVLGIFILYPVESNRGTVALLCLDNLGVF